MTRDTLFSPDAIVEFLRQLEDPVLPAAFRPVLHGASVHGAALRLGFTCLGVKSIYMLESWGRPDAAQTRRYLDRILGYQVVEPSPDGHWGRGAFVDPALAGYYQGQGASQSGAWLRAVMLAESKQAAATLTELGEPPTRPFDGLPHAPGDVVQFIEAQNWSKPWSAGGQASALVTLLCIQDISSSSDDGPEPWVGAAAQAYSRLADPETGAYFRGPRPPHGELVNGAMKVLTALDWLGDLIHYPDRLIDTCLLDMTADEGCHIVDVVYVLFRCAAQTSHRRRDIQAFCGDVVRLVNRHRQADGGYSYWVDRSQTSYYGVPISDGLPVGDIHGTTLLVWALTMCASLLDHPMADRLKVIKP